MPKCKDCFVGLSDIQYEPTECVFESTYFETDETVYKFNFCPICGHKIDYSLI